MSFSGAVKLDLSDFITPSQACVVSLNGNKIQLPDDPEQCRSDFMSTTPHEGCARELLKPERITTHLQRAGRRRAAAASGCEDSVPRSSRAATLGLHRRARRRGSGAVKVTLQDCLACSGCVTSAETVLLEHQSVAELRNKLQVRLGHLSAGTECCTAPYREHKKWVVTCA